MGTGWDSPDREFLGRGRGAIDPLVDIGAFALGATALFVAGLLLAALRPRAISDRPGVVLVALAILTLLAVAALVRPSPLGLRIALDPSSGPLLPVQDPAREAYAQARLDFGSDDVYVLAMATDDVFTHANLSALRAVTDAIRRLPGVRAAESLTHATAFRYERDLDLVDVGELIETIPSTPEELAALRARVLRDALFTRTLVSRDGRTAAVNVLFRPMSDGEFVSSGLDARIRAITTEHANAERRFYIAGGPHVRAEGHALMVRDLLRLIPLAVLLSSLVLWLMTGRKRGVFLPLGGCLVATLWTFGAMAATGRDLNVITIVLGPTLICVGCVYGVHVLARYRALAVDAATPRDAALACLEYTRTPVLIAGLTTCAGFAALWLTDTLATRELGAFAVFGVASITLLSLTGVPALLAMMPLDRDAARGAARTPLHRAIARTIERGLARLGDAVSARPGRTIVVWALLAGLAGLAVPRIVIDTDFLTFFHPESRVRSDFARVNELLVGAVPIYVTLHGDEEGVFREPETLRAVERLQNALLEVDGVSQVLSAVDLVRAASRALGGDTDAAERIPDSRPGVAEILFLVPKSRLRRFATSNHSAANLVVRTGRLGSRDIRALERDIRATLAAHPLPAGVRADVTGNAILLNRSADAIVGTQALQIAACSIVIFALVLASLRDLRIAVLAMLPNVVPVLLFFGALGAGAAPLSLPTSLIGAIALGIAVDDTVHFLVAYRHERDAGLSPEQAAAACIRRVGRPIVITSVVLVVGFLVLWPSGFVTLREFGALTALTMAFCLATDLTLLPALLVRARA